MNINCQKHLGESKDQLKSGGLKITSARLVLLDIFKHAKKPLSVKDLLKSFGGVDVDTVTLYRNVESLENLGLLKKIFINNKESFFELTSAEHHHHLICKICGRIEDIAGCKIQIKEKDLLKSSSFGKIVDHSLEFFGICNSCLA
jgi:Fur family ferric uptake transcriptional regulator